MKEIWCLFSVHNNYDQPPNNLVAWWKEKPNFEILAKAINIEFKGDENILVVVKIHQGEEQRISETDYRLEQIIEGKVPNYDG